MPHSEKLLQRETLGKNRVFTHERWQVQLENGRTAEREIIRHPGGVGIVAVGENGRPLMVRQDRRGLGRGATGSYTQLPAPETGLELVCRLLL